MTGATVTWVGSAAAVATVSATGLVTAVANGSATITATAGDASGTSEITVTNPDRAALEALYHATDGPNWVDSKNWLTDAPLGEWHGVRTDGGGRVVQLSLFDNGLVGEIPPELGDLSSLTRLRLGRSRRLGVGSRPANGRDQPYQT